MPRTAAYDGFTYLPLAVTRHACCEAQRVGSCSTANYTFLLLAWLCCLCAVLCCPQGALTALPLRCLWAIWQLLSKLLLPGSRSRSHGSNDSSSNSRASLLPGALLYDLLCALLMLGAVVVLSQIKPGVLYYWMKDITSEFLKIQVLFTALEICDKVCGVLGG